MEHECIRGIRGISQENEYLSILLCSKSRVAPLKVITILHLELCGPVLLAQLINKVKQAIDINFEKVTLWSDSTIVLSWIRSHSNKVKTFVSHRIAEIQDLSNPTDWRHVSTDENPADGMSRGLMPHQSITTFNIMVVRSNLSLPIRELLA
jgi:hypothetical protein